MGDLEKMIRDAMMEHIKGSKSVNPEHTRKMEGRLSALDGIGKEFDEYVKSVIEGPILGYQRPMIEHLKGELQLQIAEYIDTALTIASITNEKNAKFMWSEFWTIVSGYQKQMLGCIKYAKKYEFESSGR